MVVIGLSCVEVGVSFVSLHVKVIGWYCVKVIGLLYLKVICCVSAKYIEIPRVTMSNFTREASHVAVSAKL